jgi:hypothetical protein
MRVRLGDEAGKQDVEFVKSVAFPEQHLIRSDSGEVGELVQDADMTGAE